MQSVGEYHPTNISTILVLGETGAGKSFFINTIAPGKAVVGKGLESCTKELTGITTTIGNTEVMLIDTPGFDDTYMSDGDILLEISAVLAAQHKACMALMGVIYCYDITKSRLSGSSRRQLELFRKICGNENLKHVILVTTKWKSNETDLMLEDRDDELRDKHWADLIKCKAKFMRFEGTYGSATSIVSQLLGEQEVTLALVRELVYDKKPLKDTGAGVFVAESRAKMKEELDHALPSESGKLNYLRQCLEKSREDRQKLGADVVGDVEAMFQKALEKERKKQGTKPTAVNIITWVLTFITAGIGMGNLLEGLGAF